MAEKKPSGGGKGRVTILGVLLAAVGALALYLSDCVPGFGIGGGSGGEASNEAEKSDTPAKTEAPAAKPDEAAEAKPAKIVVDARGCALEGGEFQACAEFCKQVEGDALKGASAILIDAKEAPQPSVEDLLACLKAAGIEKYAIERE